MTRSTTSKIADKAKDAADHIADEAKSRAADAKDTVADQVHAQAANFREASEAFEGNALASDAVRYLGDNLAQAASAVRDLDLSNVQHDVTQFARRNPVVFFGGAAALGFLAARAMKASERAGVQVAAADRHNYSSLPENQSAYPDQNARRWGYS